MDAKAEKRQNGLGYGQKILMQVAVYFEQKIQSNLYCAQTVTWLYTLANISIFSIQFDANA